MRLYLLCIALFLLPSLRAQHYHFMYIQSDQQPFYVKFGAEPMSSSAEGFLIIPRLKDSAYEMVIGFPAKKYPEYRFRFAGFRKDRGMALKNFGDKGWGLFDYQTTEVLMGEAVPDQREAKSPRPVPLTNDAFTVVLASVIDDPGLLATPLVYMPVADAAPPAAGKGKAVAATTGAPAASSAATGAPVPGNSTAGANLPAPGKTGAIVSAPASKQPLAANGKKKSAIASTAKNTDTVSTKPVVVTGQDESAVAAAAKVPDTATVKPVAEKDAAPLKTEPAEAKPMPVDAAKGDPSPAPGIIRLRESSSAEGLSISYLDPRVGGGGDTVSILIPVEADSAPVLAKSADPVAQPSKPAADLVVADTVATAFKAAPLPTSPVQSAETAKAPVKEEMTLTDSNMDTRDTVSKAAPSRPNRGNCARMATEKDLGAVRKKMVGIRDEDEMVAVALKDFKARCYTTEQVKAICFVFTREEGRYKLLDAAYPYVYDPANFGQLEALLSDKYFIYRFNALIQK